MQNAVPLCNFIEENVGTSQVDTKTEEPYARRRVWWKMLENIYVASGESGQGEQEEGDDQEQETLQFACEKLQLAKLQLGDSRESFARKKASLIGNGNTEVCETLNLAEAIAGDFCRGLEGEIRRLIDEVIESRAFIQSLEALLHEDKKKPSARRDHAAK